MTSIRVGSLALVSCLFSAGAPVAASTFVEPSDAGDLIASALAVGAGVSSIQGRLASDLDTGFVDVDVYRIELPAGELSAQVTFSSEAPAGASGLDTALVLFDGSGKGLRADDDSGSEPRCLFCARVTETLSGPGTYYLAVFDVVDVDGPVSDDGLMWAVNVFERVNALPDGEGKDLPLTGWQLFEDPGYASGDYSIALSVATVPLPGGLPLLAGALAGLVLLAPRKRGRGGIGA